MVELDPANAQRVFVTNVLAALVKFSYAERHVSVVGLRDTVGDWP